MIEDTDIYLGIFAQRYGHAPKGEEISITETKYNKASAIDAATKAYKAA